jgi:hypothetical protein
MRFCSNCGANLPTDGQYCTHCGKVIQARRLEEPEKQFEVILNQKPLKKVQRWILIITGIFVLAAAGLALFTRRGPDSQQQDNSSKRDAQLQVDPLREARNQFVTDHNDNVKMIANKLYGYRPRYEENLGGRCDLNGPDGTTLICSQFADRSPGLELDRFTRSDLCGRGFREVYAGNVHEKLNCTGITPYHKATNQYGVKVWMH